MSDTIRQQIIISGVGGQGVLFVTRLLAEAAINKALPVFTSETHGMAQRGGTVLSHFKVGDFSSPLIRPRQADALLVLKVENIARHGMFLKPEGWCVVNAGNGETSEALPNMAAVDADTLAQKIGNPKAVNLVVLGCAMARSEQAAEGQLFCTQEDISTVLKQRFGNNPSMLEASLKALEAGYKSAGDI